MFDEKRKRKKTTKWIWINYLRATCTVFRSVPPTAHSFFDRFPELEEAAALCLRTVFLTRLGVLGRGADLAV